MKLHLHFISYSVHVILYFSTTRNTLYGTRICPTLFLFHLIYHNAAFEISDAKTMWPRSRTVQGHPRLKIMVPTDSQWVGSDSTSIDTIVSATVLETFDGKF